MATDFTQHRWFPAWRAHAAPPDADAADLGTAFGLDLSLNEMAHAPAQKPAAAPRAGWISRLKNRRKPSA